MSIYGTIGRTRIHICIFVETVSIYGGISETLCLYMKIEET